MARYVWLGIVLAMLACPALGARSGQVVSMEELRKENTIQPLVPAAMPEGFTLDHIEMVTVDRLQTGPVSPPQQAVRFVYRRPGQPGVIDIVEVPRRGCWVLDVVEADYFADWRKEAYSVMVSRSRDSIGYVIYAQPPINLPTLDEMDQVKWVAPWEAPDRRLRPLRVLPDPTVGDVGTEDAGAKWPGKHVAVVEAIKRCPFRLLAPRWLPTGYALREVELVWVTAGLQIRPKVPAQQAVRLIYARPGQSRAVNVIETRRGPENDNWAFFVLGQGYFADFERDPRNHLCWGSADGIDFVTVTKVELDTTRVTDPKQWRPLTAANARTRMP